jgi:hypothetical protein
MPARENNLKGSLKWTAQSQANAVRYKWQQGDFARKAKELFMLNAKDVTYEPLQGPSHIRLLTLEPGSSPGSIFRCSLRCVNLSDGPEYTALSYTWKLDHTVLSGGYAMAKTYAKKFLHGGDPRFEIPQDTGEARLSKEIVCNGNVIKISPNLYNALVQLRRKRTGDYWVDAICTNQKYVPAFSFVLRGIKNPSCKPSNRGHGGWRKNSLIDEVKYIYELRVDRYE